MKARRVSSMWIFRLLLVAALASAVCLLLPGPACARPSIGKEAGVAPSLPGVLLRGLPLPGQASFSKAGIAQAQTAVDFTLKDTKGGSFTLSDLLSEKPVVLIIGSFT